MPRQRTRRTARSRSSSSSSRLSAALVLLLLITVIFVVALAVASGRLTPSAINEWLAGFEQALVLPTPSPVQAPVASPQPPTTTAGDWYQLYFTDPKYPDKESDHHGGIDTYLVERIDAAQHSVDVAAYELDLDTVADALLRAKERGVAVRLVTDTDNLEESAIQRLKKGGVPVVADERSAIMHNKFVVLDGRYVWTGSWNLTINCTYRNDNNAIVIDSEALARNYGAEFEEMFSGQSFGPRSPTQEAPARVTVNGTVIECYFAPEDRIAERLVALVSQAEESIHFLAFSFTDGQLGQAMIERAQAGVSVSGVVEDRGSGTRYAQYGPLREAGIDVLTDGNPYTMHHKVIILGMKDAEDIVVTGSFNFSQSADEDNDENVLIIHSNEVAQQYREAFERIRARAVAAQEP